MDNQRKSPILALFIVLLLLLSFISCDPNEGSSLDEGHGQLLITLEDAGVSSRTILPAISMEITTYKIIGNGPGGTSFSEEIGVEENCSQNNLVKGVWRIRAEAYNKDSELIGAGIKDVTILANETTEANIEVFPTEGDGDFELAVSWEQVLTSPELTYTLTNDDDETVIRTETFTVNEANASAFLDITDLSTGYYLFEVDIAVDGLSIGKGVETLRIVDGQLTRGTLQIIIDTGGIELSIISLMDDPIDVTLDGLSPFLQLGNNMIVTATTSEPVERYAWYLNGIKLTDFTSEKITFGETLSEGDYQLTCVVWKGSIICSSQEDFTVKENVPTNGTISSSVVDATSGDPIAGASVQIVGNTSLNATTNDLGEFTINSVPLGEHTVAVAIDGYTTENVDANVESADEITTINPISMSPTITHLGNFRVVLSWGQIPSDLDSHLLTPSGHHVYYANSSPSGAGANLDVDDTDSYGPETVTVTELQDGTYTYYVHQLELFLLHLL